MDSIEKLLKIKSHTGMTQQEIAYKLNTSIQTVGSWLKAKSKPRRKFQAGINELYEKIFGLEQVSPEQLQQKKDKVISFKNPYWREDIVKSEETLKKLIVKITYHSNSIEGSTMTESDTDAVLFQKRVLTNRSLIEQLEAVNHKKAFTFALKLSKKAELQVNDVLELHKLNMAGILDNAGEFRDHSVRIMGSFVPTANPLSIEKRMEEFIVSYDKNESQLDPIALLAKTHATFEQIHPFSDGNGRVGRLLMVVLALKLGLPPVLVVQEQKKAYYKYLQEAQLKENYSLLEYFICESIMETMKVFRSIY